MTKRTLVVILAVCVTLACVSLTFAQMPPRNIDPHRHGNLAAAQNYIDQAYRRIDMAQHDNDGQLGGHAQNAKNLLMQADEELRLAADVSNAEGR